MRLGKKASSGLGQLVIPLVALAILIVFNLFRDVGFFSIGISVNNSGNKVLTGRPQVPHGEILHRQFVLVPMNDIAPDWEDPLNGRAVKSLLADLLAREGKIPFRMVTGEED